MYNETTQDQLQGICKDCGAGTLNNRINHTFDLDDDAGTVTCVKCGSDHVDVVVL